MKLSQADIDKFLYCEARLLDDKLWDDWFKCIGQMLSSGCPLGMTTAPLAIPKPTFYHLLSQPFWVAGSSLPY